MQWSTSWVCDHRRPSDHTGTTGSLPSHGAPSAPSPRALAIPLPFQILTLKQTLCQMLKTFQVLLASRWAAKGSLVGIHSCCTTKRQSIWNHLTHQASLLLLGFHRQCMVRILSSKSTELAYISPLGFNHMIKPCSNEPVALKDGGGGGGKRCCFSCITPHHRCWQNYWFRTHGSKKTQ